MTESQFFTALEATINAGLAARNVVGVKVQQGYQPRRQGAPDGMALLLWKVNLHPYGWPLVKDAWVASDPPTDPPTGQMIHTEQQEYEINIQVTGSVKQPPINPTKPDVLLPYTAGDLCKLAGRALQSAAGLIQLKAAGIGVQRLMQMPQSYWADDSGAFEQSPHFTLVFTFLDTETTVTPIIVKEGLKIVPI